MNKIKANFVYNEYSISTQKGDCVTEKKMEMQPISPYI